MNEATVSRPKRLRNVVQRACEQCRRGKRKCNGVLPCDTCLRYSRRCSFSTGDKSDTVRAHSSLGHTSSSLEDESNISEEFPQKCIRCRKDHSSYNEQEYCQTCRGEVGEQTVPETSQLISQARGAGEVVIGFSHHSFRDRTPENSFESASRGMVFSKWISRAIDKPISIRGRAWSVGLIEDRPRFNTFDVSSILTHDQYERLSLIFFDTLYPIFTVLNKKEYIKKLALVYEHQPFEGSRGFGTVILGVAALGSLFSRQEISLPLIIDRNALETLLIDKSKEILFEVSNSGWHSNSHDTIHFVQGWVLYLIYMRATSNPAAVWMASSQAVQYGELLGLPIETKWKQGQERDLSRRLFWCLTAFNFWISVELGRSYVRHIVVNSSYPEEKIDTCDYLREYLGLYDVTKPVFASESKVEDLVLGLENLKSIRPSHSALALERGYLAIMIFRRLHSLKYSFPEESVSAILHIATNGLEACRYFARTGVPWWHVANLPFQSLCMLLVLDGKRPMALVGDALNTILEVSRKFQTKELSETVRTAHTLIALIERRKSSDLLELHNHLRSMQDFDVHCMNDDGTEWSPSPARANLERQITCPQSQIPGLDDIISELLDF